MQDHDSVLLLTVQIMQNASDDLVNGSTVINCKEEGEDVISLFVQITFTIRQCSPLSLSIIVRVEYHFHWIHFTYAWIWILLDREERSGNLFKQDHKRDWARILSISSMWNIKYDSHSAHVYKKNRDKCSFVATWTYLSFWMSKQNKSIWIENIPEPYWHFGYLINFSTFLCALNEPGKDLRWFYTSFLQIITVFHGVFQISDSFLVPFGLHGRTNKQRPASNITAFPKPKLPCSIWIPSRPRSFGKKAEKSLGFPLLRGS